MEDPAITVSSPKLPQFTVPMRATGLLYVPINEWEARDDRGSPWQSERETEPLVPDLPSYTTVAWRDCTSDVHSWVSCLDTWLRPCRQHWRVWCRNGGSIFSPSWRPHLVPLLLLPPPGNTSCTGFSHITGSNTRVWVIWLNWLFLTVRNVNSELQCVLWEEVRHLQIYPVPPPIYLRPCFNLRNRCFPWWD
jgi:hypothetical protein